MLRGFHWFLVVFALKTMCCWYRRFEKISKKLPQVIKTISANGEKIPQVVKKIPQVVKKSRK